MVGGPNPEVEEGMAAEHLNGPDADAEFTTGNYGVTTTSKIEWEYVTDESATPEKLGREAWPTESEAKLPDRSHCRKRRSLADIVRAAEERNEQLKSHGHTPLLRSELIGANL